ncbi:hypothetical protein [Secundilactobacillus silagei]|uniref:hypothetical protein n=1 Tax=Secundilactobacillus silagei TaxID=1293415 RepID=UPI0006CF9104|nr:hypothetical protein [Secundilactobacillus silagei]
MVKQPFFDNKISALTLGKGLSGKSIANAAFAQNEINKVINHSKDDSLNYLGGQQAWVNITAQATSTQIQNVRFFD